MIRDDISNRLVHLAKGASEEEAGRNFLSIVNSRVLRGGTGFIRGAFRCVCFSEAPIAKLAHILAEPAIHGMPYAPLGVMIDKTTLFEGGGRPVIYQSDAEYGLLHEGQKFRHKRYEPGSGIDFAWEREWRVLIDELPLDPALVTLVVPNRAWSDYIFKEHADRLRGIAVVMENMAAAVINECPWHFIVLEDMGIKVKFSFFP